MLLTAFYNRKKAYKKKKGQLAEARKRSQSIHGGFCGSHGVCGAAVGTGICISLITDATPLSKEEWRLSNRVTAMSLLKIADHGGPRCCKRNTYLALQQAVRFIDEHFNVRLPFDDHVACDFFEVNSECLTTECPFYTR